jgi:hypothetical protein
MCVVRTVWKKAAVGLVIVSCVATRDASVWM